MIVNTNAMLNDDLIMSSIIPTVRLSQFTSKIFI